jgi:hypothetical protein
MREESGVLQRPGQTGKHDVYTKVVEMDLLKQASIPNGKRLDVPDLEKMRSGRE